MTRAFLGRQLHTARFLVFGANTDVGKTLVSAGLVRSALIGDANSGRQDQDVLVNYTKPLQCGGSDEGFVRSAVDPLIQKGTRLPWHFESKTLFNWETPASPHYASRLEDKPVSDEQIKIAVDSCINAFKIRCSKEGMSGVQILETAGGVLSPASSSPHNQMNNHSRLHKSPRVGSDMSSDPLCWGWSTQADLFGSLGLPVVLVGDGKLGGISCTLTALEALVGRGYNVEAMVFVRNENEHLEDDNVNVVACREYLNTRNWPKNSPLAQMSRTLFPHHEDGIFSISPFPPFPEPLKDWYHRTEPEFSRITTFLLRRPAQIY